MLMSSIKFNKLLINNIIMVSKWKITVSIHNKDESINNLASLVFNKIDSKFQKS